MSKELMITELRSVRRREHSSQMITVQNTHVMVRLDIPLGLRQKDIAS